MRPVASRLFTVCGILSVVFLGNALPARAAPPEIRPRNSPAEPTRPGQAPPGEEAKERALPIFKQGIVKFDAGYYREAIGLFQKAYAIFPSAKIHTRIALAHKWLGNNLKALEHYEAYLKQVLGTPEEQQNTVLVGQVKAEVKVLLQLVAQLRLVCEGPAGAEIRVNGRLAGTAPVNTLVRLAPGPINVTTLAAGYFPFKRDLQVSGGQLATVRVSLIKIKPKVVHKIINVQVPWYKRWWIWTTVGVVVAAGAAGASLGAYYGRPTRELEGVPVNHDSLGVRY